jgi:hypothetical protein
VTLTGWVSGLDATGFYLQDNSGAANSGIFVAWKDTDTYIGTTTQSVVQDANVQVTGTLAVVGGQLQVVTTQTSVVCAPGVLNNGGCAGSVGATSTSVSSFSSAACGNIALEGQVVYSLSSVTLNPVSAGSGSGSQFGWMSGMNIPVASTHAYMKAIALGGVTLSSNTAYSIRGFVAGTPGIGNLFSVLNPRGLSDLGIIQATGAWQVNQTTTCTNNGGCTGCTPVSSTVSSSACSYTAPPTQFIPATIFDLVQRPSLPAVANSLSFSSGGFTGIYPSLSVLAGNDPGAGGFLSSTYIGSGGAAISNYSLPAPLYNGQWVYVEGFFNAPLPEAYTYAISSNAVCQNIPANSVTGSVQSPAANCTPPAGVTPALFVYSGTPTAYPTPCGIAATPSEILNTGGSGCGGTKSCQWCAACTVPGGYYLGTNENQGASSGLFVNLEVSQVLSIYGSAFSPTTYCPTFTGASLMPSFPTPTSSMRVGVAGMLTTTAAYGGVQLSNIVFTKLLHATSYGYGATQTSPAVHTTAAFGQLNMGSGYGFGTQLQNYTSTSLVPTVIYSPCPSGGVACPLTLPSTAALAQVTGHPAFVPFKGVLISIASATVLSYSAVVTLDPAVVPPSSAGTTATESKNVYVVTSTNATIAPLIVAATIYNSWDPAMPTYAGAVRPPSLFQCAVLSPLTGIMDFNSNLNMWVLYPRSADDINGGSQNIALDPNCVPACTGAPTYTFPPGGTPVNLASSSVAQPCPIPPPPPNSPPPPVLPPPPPNSPPNPSPPPPPYSPPPPKPSPPHRS